MDALRLLNYTAVGVGLNETAMPLLEALAEYALNNPKPPVTVANLKNPKNYEGMVKAWTVSDGGFKVGVVGVAGPSVAGEVRDPAVGFDAAAQVLPGVLEDMQKAEKPELLVLLCQGSVDDAKALAGQFPQFHVILALSEEEEPPERPDPAGKALIVRVGHKGREIGMVGVYRSGNQDKPFELHYQLVPVGPEYETPPGKDADNPILGQLEKYAQEVKRGNYLAHYANTKHPIQLHPKYAKATYVGSERCKNCHAESYKVWKNSPHSHAYDTLVKAKRPALRQFDGECVVCHVTGFKYEKGFTSETATPKLLDNGCENCHGPGSLHMKNNYDPVLNALMNPFKAPPDEAPQAKEKRMLLFERSCTECHDQDNDVHWKIDKWDKIIHREPKE
jgi:hypothetical protein